MKISQFYKARKHTFSFEFFPPKNEEGEKKLYESIEDLKGLKPSFVSVTYGAMGTTRDHTLQLVSNIKNQIGIEVAAHLTCVGHTRFEIEGILQELVSDGIENIVALRGDPPKDEKEFIPAAHGFQYASELVRFIKNHPRFKDAFSLAVAGYPETHVACRDKQKDLEHLKIKVDQGADAVITQLFFNNRDYFDFTERARKIGIKIPIIPGIMPVTNGAQLGKFASMCGCFIPDEMRQTILKYGDDQKAIEAYGIEYATRQCEALLKQGVPGLHFYTLNRSHATRKIYRNLGLK